MAGPHDTLEVSLAYWPELAVQCEINGVERLLVVEDLKERSTLAGNGRRALAHRLPRRPHRLRRRPRGPRRAAELMAKTAGLTGRVFSEFAPAEAWLLADLREAAPSGGGQAA